MHNIMTPAGDIIRAARERKNMTQEALADKAETTGRTIIAIEKNQRHPTYEVFSRIIHALDISADLFFYPERHEYTATQDQFIREFLSCNADEQRIVLEALRGLMRALRNNSR